MISEINRYWNWKGFIATEIILTNDFGNVIFKTDRNEYWRICPEELSCNKIANNEFDFNQVLNDDEFIKDWEMKNLVDVAKSELGGLQEDEKYCLKIPAIMGGVYDKTNIAKIRFGELIEFSGDLGYKVKDLKDGQTIELKITD